MEAEALIFADIATPPESAIIVATKDRPKNLAETLQSIKRQTRHAAHFYVSVRSLEDAPRGNSAEGVTVVAGPPEAQRLSKFSITAIGNSERNGLTLADSGVCPQ